MTSTDEIMKLMHNDIISAYTLFHPAKILMKYARQGPPKFMLRHCPSRIQFGPYQLGTTPVLKIRVF